MCEQIAWPRPFGSINPLIARFSASEQLRVKTKWFGSSPLKSWLRRRRHSVIALIYGSDTRQASTIADAPIR